MQALILCGGFGTRLKSVVADRPKPMAEIGGKPFLEYVLDFLVNQGIKDIILCTGYLGYQIKEYFLDGSRWGCHLSYSEEKEPLGTGGAVKQAEYMISSEHFFVLNGDTFLDLDYGSMYAWHTENQSKFTIALTQVENTDRYGSVELGQGQCINRFCEKGCTTASNYINAGVYLCHRSILDHIERDRKVSMETDVFPDLMKKHITLHGFTTNGYFIDIGIPETYYQFQKDIIRR